MNPDCRDGKHASCSGQGWDEVGDCLGVCPCGCHSTALEPAEPVLEGVIVGEGMRNGNPATSNPCRTAFHKDCSGLRYDLLSMQDLPCECSCHKTYTAPGFAAGGVIPKARRQPGPDMVARELAFNMSNPGKLWEFLRGSL